MLYLVSPFMDNGTLAGWRSSLNPSAAGSVAEIQSHVRSRCPQANRVLLNMTQILQVAQGLQYIHSQGIVHADIRGVSLHAFTIFIAALLTLTAQSNILLDINFRPKIADFGLARHSEATGVHSDSLSPYFMAPELFGRWEDDEDLSGSDDMKKIERTPYSDVYAFGCLYYEVCYRMPPAGFTS